MNYEKLYFAFIEKYKNQVFDEGVYTEVHHIRPRHAGGDDSKENLIRLTYRQHVFAHLLLWKAFENRNDKIAYTLMTSVDIDKVKFLRSEFGKIQGEKNKDFMKELGKHYGPINGKRNVESGLLDRIRHLANNEDQRDHARQLAESRRNNGYFKELGKIGKAAWLGSNHTDEWKEAKSEQMKEWASIDENYNKLLERNKRRGELATQKSKEFSENLILNAERNEEFLQESSSRSKNKFVSPEGLEFDSPIFAARYYSSTIEPYIIENWCKRNKYGWSRKPKAE